MGLDSDLLITIMPLIIDEDSSLLQKHDGWPVSKMELRVVSLRKYPPIHAWACNLSDGQAHACRAVEVSVDQLKELEGMLERYATDPKAMPECPQKYWGSFFGVPPNDPDYPAELAHYMQEAPAIAKKVRKMWEYIEAEKAKPVQPTPGVYKPLVYGVYRASW